MYTRTHTHTCQEVTGRANKMAHIFLALTHTKAACVCACRLLMRAMRQARLTNANIQHQTQTQLHTEYLFTNCTTYLYCLLPPLPPCL